MRVKLHPEARAEPTEAYRWFNERSPLTATAFAHAVDVAVSRIEGAPTQYPLADHATRKFVLQRFPFNLFYLPRGSKIVIVAVAHQKRRPGYWTARIPLP